MGILKKYRGCLAGGFCLLLSALYFKGSFIETSQLMTAKYGPGFMPKICSLALCCLSLVLIYQETRKLKKSQEESLEEESQESRSEIRVMLTAGLILLYIALIKKAGFLVSSAFYVVLQMIVIEPPGTGKKQYVRYLVFGIITSAVLTYLFTKVFSVALPAGMLGF